MVSSENLRPEKPESVAFFALGEFFLSPLELRKIGYPIFGETQIMWWRSVVFTFSGEKKYHSPDPEKRCWLYLSQLSLIEFPSFVICNNPFPLILNTP
jgi:hypothetical protein